MFEICTGGMYGARVCDGDSDSDRAPTDCNNISKNRPAETTVRNSRGYGDRCITTHQLV
jgi:hypothetical protein